MVSLRCYTHLVSIGEPPPNKVSPYLLRSSVIILSYIMHIMELTMDRFNIATGLQKASKRLFFSCA